MESKRRRKKKRCILCNRTMRWWEPSWYGVSHFKCAIRAIEEAALKAKPSRLNKGYGVWSVWRDVIDFERAIEKMRNARK
jgi:hypothetical protein